MMQEYDYFFKALALLISGTDEERRIMLGRLRPEYFPENCFGDIFVAVTGLEEAKKPVDILTVYTKLTCDDDSERLHQRLDDFRHYFEKNGTINRQDSDELVKRQTAVLLASISQNMSYSIPPEYIAYCVQQLHCSREKKKLLEDYLKKNDENPFALITDELAERMKALEENVLDKSWEDYLVNPFDLPKTSEEMAVIFREGRPFFWRGNIYLISGYAGVMKSFLCMVIAAAAINRGTGADRTLSFHSYAWKLKALFVDTELATNTIIERMDILKKLTGENLDVDRFKYVALKGASGGIMGKLNKFEAACRDVKPDVIIVDSARDFCYDFNDNREAEALVKKMSNLATIYNAILISTCHRTIGTGNAKGHFGTIFNEAAGLEMQLTKNKTAQIVDVEFTKQRDSNFAPFSFRYDEETKSLIECTPHIDHTAKRRQEKSAELCVRRVLRPGEDVRYKILLSRITGTGVSESTAKQYINALVGTVLVKKEDGSYRLSDTESELGLENDDLPEG